MITAEQAPRERELDGSESLGGLTVETTSSVMGTSSPDTETSSAPPGKSTLGKAANDSTFADSGHPGKGLANRSERANEVARNTEKNPHLSGSHPGQGLANRSDRANERAQNTNKNPHLIGGGDGGDGTTPPGGGIPGGGSGGGNSGGGSAGAGADFLYYYHPDHLGSTGYVTDDQGQLYEHVLYFPFGETWVEQASNTWRTPYLYTSKELDPETGLYYFGARYYDPRTSVWQSADPILAKYLDGQASASYGVFVTSNLALYTYSRNNPVILKDPDGNIAPIVLLPFAVAALFVSDIEPANTPTTPDDVTSESVSLLPLDLAAEGLKQVAPESARTAIDVVSSVGNPKKAVQNVGDAVANLKELHRPYIRKGVREKVEANAPRDADGNFIDPNTGESIQGKYDLGHKPGHEFRREKAKAEAGGLTQPEFNDRMNNPDLYQIESP